MIILDWNKNSEEVLAQGHYNTVRSVNAEQTHLCQYWQEQGVDKNEAYKIWVSLESPQVVGSLSEEESREYFDRFWSKAADYGYNIKYQYGLTYKEYDFINKLDVDREYKDFLKTLIECCRSYGNGNSFFCPKVRWKELTKGDRLRNTTERVWKMAAWASSLNLYTLLEAKPYFRGKRHDGYIVNLFFIDQEGDRMVNTPSFDNFNATCSKCGSRFIASPHSQTSLCKWCQAEERNRKKRK